jgi:hypothetical protein
VKVNIFPIDRKRSNSKNKGVSLLTQADSTRTTQSTGKQASKIIDQIRVWKAAQAAQAAQATQDAQAAETNPVSVEKTRRLPGVSSVFGKATASAKSAASRLRVSLSTAQKAVDAAQKAAELAVRSLPVGPAAPILSDMVAAPKQKTKIDGLLDLSGNPADVSSGSTDSRPIQSGSDGQLEGSAEYASFEGDVLGGAGSKKTWVSKVDALLEQVGADLSRETPRTVEKKQHFKTISQGRYIKDLPGERLARKSAIMCEYYFEYDSDDDDAGPPNRPKNTSTTHKKRRFLGMSAFGKAKPERQLHSEGAKEKPKGTKEQSKRRAPLKPPSLRFPKLKLNSNQNPTSRTVPFI